MGMKPSKHGGVTGGYPGVGCGHAGCPGARFGGLHLNAKMGRHNLLAEESLHLTGTGDVQPYRSTARLEGKGEREERQHLRSAMTRSTACCIHASLFGNVRAFLQATYPTFHA